jgi:hypothetical protein
VNALSYGLETRRSFEFFLALYPCHPDRSARGGSTLQEFFGAEWRDPEGVSSAIAASRRSHETAANNRPVPREERSTSDGFD